MRRMLVCCSLVALCGGLAFAGAPAPLKVVMLSGSWEYKSAESLPVFKEFLEKHLAGMERLLVIVRGPGEELQRARHAPPGRQAG